MWTTKVSPTAVTGGPLASISIPELSMATCPCGSHRTRNMADGSAGIVRSTSIRSVLMSGILPPIVARYRLRASSVARWADPPTSS